MRDSFSVTLFISTYNTLNKPSAIGASLIWSAFFVIVELNLLLWSQAQVVDVCSRIALAFTAHHESHLMQPLAIVIDIEHDLLREDCSYLRDDKCLLNEIHSWDRTRFVQLLIVGCSCKWIQRMIIAFLSLDLEIQKILSTFVWS